MPSIRDQQIQSDYDRLKKDTLSSAEVHRLLGRQYHLSASRIRHILSAIKKEISKQKVSDLPSDNPSLTQSSDTNEFPDKKFRFVLIKP